jgi:hypothetical protein
MEYIRVTNRTDTAIEGRYAGRDFLFKPGVPLDVPEIVAMHVFAFGVNDKMACLARLGWLSTSDQIKAAIEKLNLIKMEAVEMVGQLTEDEDEDLPADTETMVPEKISSVSPDESHGGGGTKAGVLKAPAYGPMSAKGSDFDVQ